MRLNNGVEMVYTKYDHVGPLETIENYWRHCKEAYEANGNGRVPSFEELMDISEIDRSSIDENSMIGVKDFPPRIDILPEDETPIR